MQKLKIYYPTELFNSNQRGSWFELLKSKQRYERDGRNLDMRIQLRLEWVQDEQDADLYILPLDWKYYYQNKKKLEAIAFCKSPSSG